MTTFVPSHRQKPTGSVVGASIRRLRIDRGWTQNDLARRIGIDPVSVSKYERGRYEPTLRVLIDFADAFGVSLDELVGREVLKVPA